MKRQAELGAYYTPYPIVEFLTDYIKEQDGIETILEPSAGDNRFIRPLKNYKITALEIDKDRCQEPATNIDFLDYYNKDNKFDCFVGNPPYIGYNKLTEYQKEKIPQIFLDADLPENKITNLWAIFLLGCFNMLKVGGNFAFVIPIEFFFNKYAEQIRNYIFLNSDEVNIVNFMNNQFEEVQQSTFLFYGKKGISKNETKVRISQAMNKKGKTKTIKVDEVKNWKALFMGINLYDEFYKNSRPLSDYCFYKTGILTGNDKVFILPDNEIEKRKLRPYALPLANKGENLIIVIKQDKAKFYLLDFNKELDKHAKAYIKEIEEKNLHSNYKLKIRKNWWEVPSISSSDLILQTNIGDKPRLIKNDNRFTNTSFFRLNMKEGRDPYELIFLFYSSLTGISLELAGRTYASGVLNLIPASLNATRVPVVDKEIDFKRETEKIDKMLREGKDITPYVDKVIGTEKYSDAYKELREYRQNYKNIDRN